MAVHLEGSKRRVTASVSIPSRSATPGQPGAGALEHKHAAKRFPQTRAQRLLVSFALLFSVGLLVVAFSDAVREFNYREMVHALRHLPPSAIACAFGGTALSFAALVGRDASALRYIGARVSTPALLIGGFCGSALGNAVGFGPLTAAAVRYRIYGAVGVTTDEIARLLVFVAGGFAIGLAGVGGFAGLLKGGQAAALLGWPPALIEGASIAALAAVSGLLAFGLPGTIRIGSLSIPAPGRRLLAAQLALTSIRLLGAVLALWSLLPETPVSFVTFAAIFSAATALAAITHIPAGAGIFEAIVLWAFRGHASEESVAAALIAYRFIYYVLPLIISAAAFSMFEVGVAVGGERARQDERLTRAAARLAPTFMGVMAFAAGVMLLVSGATPTFNSRLAALALHVPLWAVETSHFMGSLVGVLFLFVTVGLLDRRDGAWKLALALSATGLVFSLLKGLAFGEAAFLLLFATMLLATRQQFHRPTSMFDQPFTWGWFVAVGGVIAAAFGILWLAFHDAACAQHGPWWRFEFDAQAPRAMRALLGASVLTAGIGLRELLRAPKGLAPKPDAAELAQVEAILQLERRGDAMLAFMGDKSLLFSESGRSFLMFGKRGRSWIALFDPVGPREEWTALIDRFIRLSQAHSGRAAFYQVRPDSLPYYLDAGLSVMKLGEDAVIALAAFNMKGGAAAHLRYALKRGERDGLEFELLAPERVRAFMSELNEISSQWLEGRRGDEKGFSVAAFDPGYLARQRVAVLREHGRTVAFVSVMATDAGGEATIGLMRSSGAACPVAMEFLFTRLILALKDEGLDTLSLGATPLAGIRPAPLSSQWHQLGALIWKHGDRFYNFKGLRTFKGKFNPEWQPRYFAASGALSPYVAMADAAALIGGGFVSANAEQAYD